MSRSFQIFLVFAFSLLTTSITLATETAYISSLQTKLYAQPNFTAPLKAQLQKGEKVTIKKTQGAWTEVSSTKGEGWVSKFVLSKTPPMSKVTVLPGSEEIKLKDIRRRTSAITTAAAARGLADVAKASQQDRYVSNPEGVRYMESFKIPTRELLKFSQAVQQADQGGQP